jgi:phage FluMu protein Com
MDKTIKILALTNQQTLISELVEVAAIDIGAPDCKLINPFTIKEDGTLVPYLLSVTRDDTFMMSSDKILTLCEPTPTLLEKYLDLLNE